MKVYRSINNNIVSAYDDEGREIVVIGKGIGYKAGKGTTIPPSKINKIFTIRSNNEMAHFKDIFSSLPEKYFDITNEIVSYANKYLKRPLHENIYITLADHMHFTVMHFRKDIYFPNVLHSEIRRFYAGEYALGKYALELIRKQLGVTLPDDEAASIALHIFNAEYDASVNDAFHGAHLLDHILNIVIGEIEIQINEHEYYGELFITHLKSLIQRVFKKEELPRGDHDLFDFTSHHYPKELTCAGFITDYISEIYGYSVSQEEAAYLAMHIKRIRTVEGSD